MTHQSEEDLRDLIAAELFLTEIVGIGPFGVPEELIQVQLTDVERLAERCQRVLKGIREVFGEDLGKLKIQTLHQSFRTAEEIFRRVAAAGKLLNLNHVSLGHFISTFGWPRDPRLAIQAESNEILPVPHDAQDLPVVFETARLLARHSLPQALNFLDAAALRHPADPAPLLAAARLARLYGAQSESDRYQRLLKTRFGVEAPTPFLSPRTAAPAPLDQDAELMRGQLGRLTFFDAVQICETARFTAVLSLFSSSLTGNVFFNDGVLVDAELAAPSVAAGRHALKLLTELLDRTPASFAVRLAPHPFERVIVASSTSALLMAVAAELDEEKHALQSKA